MTIQKIEHDEIVNVNNTNITHCFSDFQMFELLNVQKLKVQNYNNSQIQKFKVRTFNILFSVVFVSLLRNVGFFCAQTDKDKDKEIRIMIKVKMKIKAMIEIKAKIHRI